MEEAMPLRAVLFDFDGTLADSYDAIAASVNHVRAHHGLPPLSVAEVRVHVGRGPGYLLAHTVGVGDAKENEARYRQHHPTVMRQGTRLLPGAAEALHALKQSGLKLAVCSNKPRAYTKALLESLGIAPLFDAVLGPEDVKRPKPAPDMLLAALERLKVHADEALYVGDMTVDITTARGAGVRVWVVPTGSDSREAIEAAQPDQLLASLAELLQLLLSIR
jgi:phosphoglycolate phosphatase